MQDHDRNIKPNKVWVHLRDKHESERRAWIKFQLIPYGQGTARTIELEGSAAVLAFNLIHNDTAGVSTEYVTLADIDDFERNDVPTVRNDGVRGPLMLDLTGTSVKLLGSFQ